ncbi:MAG: mechanosensitive ion channel [Phycisphaerae bacterium]|nr:mechanosensitive ion channel [Phycisphaerae bacterium]
MKCKENNNSLIAFVWWISITCLFALLFFLSPHLNKSLQHSKLFGTLSFIALSFAISSFVAILIRQYIYTQKKPAVEIEMLKKPVRIATFLIIGLIAIYGFGKLTAFISFFSIFGGLLLGLSLQTPLSGLVAWLLICLKRSIRPGDRVQFPNLNLTGDIEDVGAMYLTLNQVGGSITSEEAVGRRVLIPNAMLFTNVAINYTVSQEAAYILDEVVVRITYNSDWEKAEEILLNAAENITRDIIQATGTKPYIRSNLYDYGVYLRLRYKTKVQDRAEIAYNIEKEIFETIQKTSSVDLAIPYVYSYRAAMDEVAKNIRPLENVLQIPLEKIRHAGPISDITDIKQLAESIAERGLLQPILVEQKDGFYEIVAGHLRFEACKYLGWTKIAALLSNIKQ